MVKRDTFWSVLCLPIAVLGLYGLLNGNLSGPLLDFSVYLEATRVLLDGGDIYTHSYSRVTQYGEAVSLYYFYPPLLVCLIAPFIQISPESLSMAWQIVNVALLISSAYLIARIGEHTRYHKVAFHLRVLVSLTLLIVFLPTYVNFIYGQLNIAVLFFLLLWIRAHIENRSCLAGAALSLAIWLKMSPAFLILALVPNRDFRTLGWTGLWSVGIALALLLGPVSVDTYEQFVLMFFTLAQGKMEAHYSGNIGFAVCWGRWLGIYGFGYLEAILKLIPLGLLLLVFYVRRKRNRMSLLHVHGATVSVMLLMQPVLWPHHLVWLVIPLLVMAFATCPRRISSPTWILICFCLTFILVCLIAMLDLVEHANHEQYLFIVSLPSFWMLLCTLTLMCVPSDPKETAT